jgi:hypothetical protein
LRALNFREGREISGSSLVKSNARCSAPFQPRAGNARSTAAFWCAAHKGHSRSLLKKQIGSVWRFFDPPASASNESVQPAEQDREHGDG